MRRILATCVLVCSWAAGAHAAGGAFAVDDAAIGKVGACHVESWISLGHNGDFVGLSQPACVVRLGLPVEIRATLQGTQTDHEWATHGALQAKTVLLPVDPRNVGIALSVGTSFDLAKGESAVSYINLPVTIKIHEQFRVNANSGWSFDALNATHHFTWGAGLEWEFKKSWVLIAELYGQSGQPSEPRTQVGVRYQPDQNIDIDVIYGHNIAGENAHWITTGVTMRF